MRIGVGMETPVASKVMVMASGQYRHLHDRMLTVESN
jgi:hypothetical protein